MNLSYNADLNDFNALKSIVNQKYPNLDTNNINAFYLKKLPKADVLNANKPTDYKGNTSHIACTGDSRQFFYNPYGNAIVNDYTTPLSKKIPVFVESKYFQNTTTTTAPFVPSECSIWVFPKQDKNQIGLSKVEYDGSAFKALRNNMCIDDILIFFKYVSSKNTVDIYTLLLKHDDASDITLINLFGSISSPKYYEILTLNNLNALISESIEEAEESEEANSSSKDKLIGFNKLFLGAPGTGKSDYVNKNYYINKNAKRVTFHAEYTYHDFVGTIKPVIINNKLSYDFVPGVFTEILLAALEDSSKEYNLIIEELNRANTASVFGDLFQLLDRKDGVSQYPIHNSDIISHMKKYFDPNYSSVIIPTNLNIIATMNSSDQNIVPLDTAFKRRWEVVYMPIEFTDDHIFKDKLINNLNISWKDFVITINSLMMSNENSDLMISEDKQLGPYFIKSTELDDSKKFAYKVFLYLWDDVFKMDRYRLFDINIRTFSELVKVFESNSPFNIFAPNVSDILKSHIAPIPPAPPHIAPIPPAPPFTMPPHLTPPPITPTTINPSNASNLDSTSIDED